MPGITLQKTEPVEEATEGKRFRDGNEAGMLVSGWNSNNTKTGTRRGIDNTML